MEAPGDDVLLHVCVLSARGLAARQYESSNLFSRRSRTTSSPFVRVSSGERERFTTGVVKKSLNPAWGDVARLELGPDFELRFEVFDHRSMGRNEYMGECKLGVADIPARCKEEAVEVWLPLVRDPTKSRVRCCEPARCEPRPLTRRRAPTQDVVSGELCVSVAILEGDLSRARHKREDAPKHIVLNKSHVRPLPAPPAPRTRPEQPCGMLSTFPPVRESWGRVLTPFAATCAKLQALVPEEEAMDAYELGVELARTATAIKRAALEWTSRELLAPRAMLLRNAHASVAAPSLPSPSQYALRRAAGPGAPLQLSPALLSDLRDSRLPAVVLGQRVPRAPPAQRPRSGLILSVHRPGPRERGVALLPLCLLRWGVSAHLRQHRLRHHGQQVGTYPL